MIIASCFHLLPVFRPALSDGVIKIFRLLTPVAMATNFGTKFTTTRPLWKIIAPVCIYPLYTQLLGYFAI